MPASLTRSRRKCKQSEIEWRLGHRGKEKETWDQQSGAAKLGYDIAAKWFGF